MNIYEKLKHCSRAETQEKNIKVGLKLHDAAIGSIYFATVPKTLASVESNQGSKSALRDSVILKTIDLQTQNIYAVVNGSRKILRGQAASDVLFMHQDLEECKVWIQMWKGLDTVKNASICKIAWILDDHKTGTKKVRCNEYLNEAMVGLIIAKHLSKVPHYVITKDCFINDATGYIVQEHGGQNLLKELSNLSLPEFKSVVAQSLVALAYAQETIFLKHHDLHLENVFLGRLKDLKNADGLYLKSNDTWSYTFKASSELSELKVFINHCGLLARLADYGLGSATDIDTGMRYERVDYALLDSTEAEWGSWSSQLEGQWTYDAVVFLSKFFIDDEMTSCPPENLAWAQQIYKDLKAKWPIIECSTIGRPLRGREGSAKIRELFTLPSMAEFLVPVKALSIF